jgi:hypothetical protein
MNWRGCGRMELWSDFQVMPRPCLGAEANYEKLLSGYHWCLVVQMFGFR